jgi:LysW-gamma-L-lysine carboxypeptidase
LKSRKDPAVDLLVESLRIYSPSMKEGALSSTLRERMKERGFRNVRTDKAGNAIGEVGQGKPHVLFCGHMDTVPGFLKVRVEGDRVYGRGAADAKSPMCAMISAAAASKHQSLRVTMACVTREEGDSLGVNTLIDDGGDYEAAVFGEPGGASRMALGYRGRVEGVLTVKTSGGHASSSWAHSSAVDEALQIVSKMRRYEKAGAAGVDHYRSVNVSVTIIRGGTYSNVIPKTCTVTLDIRTPPGRSSAAVKSDLSGLVDEQAHARPDVRFQLGFGEATEAYEAPTDSVVMRAFQRSILKNLKTRPIMTHKTGTGDMNTFAEVMGIPCLTYGPGDTSLGHTEIESIEIPDYLNSITVLRGALGEIQALSRAK